MHVLTAIAALLALFGSAAAQNPIDWVYRDKIRMGWSPSTLDDYDAMKAAGMNAVMPRLELDAVEEYDPAEHLAPLSERDAEVIEKLRATSRKANAVDLKYFHCLDIAASSQTARIGFKDNPARYNDGDLPSPIDAIYWRRGIVDRVRRAMDLLEGEDYAFDAVIIPGGEDLDRDIPAGHRPGSEFTYRIQRGSSGIRERFRYPPGARTGPGKPSFCLGLPTGPDVGGGRRCAVRRAGMPPAGGQRPFDSISVFRAVLR